MSGLFGLRHGSWGNGWGWLFLAAMIALLFAIDFAILPEHADVFMISAMSWAWMVVIGGIAVCRGRTWRFADLLRGRG